jgi:hypothetical protein
MYTCSFHHGTECVPVHNRREISAKEAHIDEEGIHFSWIDEDISDAYERIFGEALVAPCTGAWIETLSSL